MNSNLITFLSLSLCIGCWLLSSLDSVSAAIRNHQDQNGDSGVDGGDDQSHPKVAWPIVVPVKQLREGRQVFGSSENYTTEFPHWVNRTLLDIGQKFYARHFYAFEYTSALTSLLMGKDTQRVLISAGNSSDVPKASRRFLINVLNFYYWATTDLTHEDFWESMNLVHAIHAKVGHEAHRRKHIYQKPLLKDSMIKLDTKVWNAFERDLMASPLRRYKRAEIFPPHDGQTEYPLNQHAMTIQLWAFFGPSIIDPKQTLMPDATDEELWGYVHFWALIGRASGIMDKYNVCLQPDLATTREYFKEVLYDYYVPTLLNLDNEHRAVMETLVGAASKIVGYLDLPVSLYRLCVDILHIQCPHVQRTIPPLGNVANRILNRAQPFIALPPVKQFGNFVVNGMTQRFSLRNFNLNPLLAKHFNDGLLELDREILRTSDVHWKGDNSL